MVIFAEVVCFTPTQANPRREVQSVNIEETGPSVAAMMLTAATRLTLRVALTAISANPLAAYYPWPYRAIEQVAGLYPKSRYVAHEKVLLKNATAELIRAPGVEENADRAVLYLHGGAFLACGPNTHRALATRLS